MSKRVLAMTLAILAFFLFVGSPFQQAAKAVALVDDAIIAIVIAALAALGITFSMTGGYQTAEDWIREEIANSGIDFSGVKYGASSVGNILLNNRFVKCIAAFADYLRVKLGLVDNSTVNVISSDVIAGGYVTYTGTFEVDQRAGGGQRYRKVTPSHPLANFIVCKEDSNGIAALYFDTSSFYVTIESKANFGSLNTSSKAAEKYIVDGVETGLWYLTAGAYASNFGIPEQYTYYNENWSTVLNNVYERGIEGGGNSLDVNTSTISIPDDTTIGDDGGILSLPIPWGQSLPTTIDQIPDLVLDDDLSGNTTLELEDASAVEDQISDTATAEQPYVSSSASDYQSPGLQSVFPFCIPFDIYAFFECLVADPVAPSFTWRFYIPGICDEDIEIDLAAFDSAARILRTMELLLFIVGLAFVTRDKFLRG